LAGEPTTTLHNTTVFVFIIPDNTYSLHFIKW
jgi:hypothetical protein